VEAKNISIKSVEPGLHHVGKSVREKLISSGLSCMRVFGDLRCGTLREK